MEYLTRLFNTTNLERTLLDDLALTAIGVVITLLVVAALVAFHLWMDHKKDARLAKMRDRRGW
jgi:hypothetical protein